MTLICVLRVISATIYKYTSDIQLHAVLVKLQACIGMAILVLMYDKKGLRSTSLSVNYYLKSVKFYVRIFHFLNERFFLFCGVR